MIAYRLAVAVLIILILIWSNLFKLVIVIEFIARLISVGIDIITFAMIGRAILPLFVDTEENKLYLFTLMLTEPVVAPVRYLMVKFNILQDSPFDWSFTVAYILLIVISGFLPVI